MIYRRVITDRDGTGFLSFSPQKTYLAIRLFVLRIIVPAPEKRDSYLHPMCNLETDQQRYIMTSLIALTTP